MRKFIIAVVLLVGVVFVISRFTEMQEIWETIQRGELIYLLIALAIQIAWIINNGASFWAIYQAMGIKEELTEMIHLAGAAFFANVVAPTAGMSAMAIFVARARQQRYSAGKGAISGTLYVLLDYSAFFCVLALGLIVLFRRGNLTSPEIIASIYMFTIAAGLAFLLFLGMRSAERLGYLLAWFIRQANRVAHLFRRGEFMAEERAHRFAHDAAEALTELRREPKNLIQPFAFALFNKTLMLGVLMAVFWAFQIPYSIGTLVAGFSIAYLFLVVSPTPSGIGIVEGVLTVTLRTLYVPLEAAALITLTYRGFTFWLPLFYGMYTFRRLGKANPADSY